MAIAIVEELWTRIRAAIDDKIVAAEAAAVRAEAASQSASQSAEAGAQPDTVGRVHLTPALRGEIDGKSAPGHTHTLDEVDGLDTALAGKATKADVTAAVAALVDGAPAALDTLGEIATELNENKSDRAVITNTLAGKADTGHRHTWDQVDEKPATFPPTTGTTPDTAAPGNHTHTAAQVGAAPADHSHSQYAESSRVTALEGSQPIIVSSLPPSPQPGRIYLVTG